jgi:dihydrofolate reductase
MRSLILYTACSIDNYIAGPQGEIDWLLHDGDYGYQAFYERIDTLLMGRNTFDYVARFDPYPHLDRKNCVFTMTLSGKPEDHLQLVAGDPVEFTRKLKEKEGRDIWLVGGGQINGLLMQAGLIDEIILSIHPIVLGRGIRLFAGPVDMQAYRTVSAQHYASGLVQCHFKKA